MSELKSVTTYLNKQELEIAAKFEQLKLKRQKVAAAIYRGEQVNRVCCGVGAACMSSESECSNCTTEA